MTTDVLASRARPVALDPLDCPLDDHLSHLLYAEGERLVIPHNSDRITLGENTKYKTGLLTF